MFFILLGERTDCFLLVPDGARRLQLPTSEQQLSAVGGGFHGAAVFGTNLKTDQRGNGSGRVAPIRIRGNTHTHSGVWFWFKRERERERERFLRFSSGPRLSTALEREHGGANRHLITYPRPSGGGRRQGMDTCCTPIRHTCVSGPGFIQQAY